MSKQVNFSAHQKQIFSWLVCFIIPISGICIDVYAPSLPHVVTSFATSKSLVQFSITSYLLGFACGQLIAGPVSDSYGRRNIMLWACCLFIFVTIGAIFSPSIHVLLFFRLFQGLTISFLVVPGRAILSDCFVGKQFMKKITVMAIFWALGPIVAPAIGGLLQHFFVWQASFWFMMIYVCIILFLLFTVYQETHSERSSFSITTLFGNYRSIMKDGFFILAMIFSGVLCSSFVVFNVVAPFLIQTTLKFSPLFYGFVALLMGLAWFLGNTVNSRMLGFSLARRTEACLIIMFLTLIAMVVFTLYFELNIYLLTIPMWIVILCSGIIFPNYIGLSLARFPHLAGSANALLFSGIWLTVTLASVIAAHLHIHSLLPFAVYLAGLSGLCVLLYYFSLKARLISYHG